MSATNVSSANSPQSQFVSSLNDEQKTKYSQGQQDAKALKEVFAKDTDGAKKQEKFAEAMKEDNPIKKMMMLNDFEKSLNPDEKKALEKMKDDHKTFNDSLKGEQKDKEKELGKQAVESGHASLGGVFDLSS
jgi:hypothetical protein